MGVWIETTENGYDENFDVSHPTWVCGLKHLITGEIEICSVTPYVGVWIET